MEDAFDLVRRVDDKKGGDVAGFHKGESSRGEGVCRDGDGGRVHDIAGGEGEGAGTGAFEHAAEISVGDDALKVAVVEDGGEAELFAGHLVDDIGHEGGGSDGGDGIAGVHEVLNTGEFEAEMTSGVDIREVPGGEATALTEGKGKSVAEGEHNGGRGRRGEFMRTGFFGDGEIDREVGGAGKGGGGGAAERDEFQIEALGDGKEGEDFRGFAARRERKESVAGREHAEIAMEGFCGMEEVRRGSGGAEGGSDLPGDEAALADTGEDERAGGLLEEVQRGLDGGDEVGVEAGGEGGESSGFSGDDLRGGDVGAVAGSVTKHRG